MIWNGLEIPDNPYYQDGAVIIYHADCRDILPLIPNKSVDLVLTDPPYGIGEANHKPLSRVRITKDWKNPKPSSGELGRYYCVCQRLEV